MILTAEKVSYTPSYQTMGLAQGQSIVILRWGFNAVDTCQKPFSLKTEPDKFLNNPFQFQSQ